MRGRARASLPPAPLDPLPGCALSSSELQIGGKRKSEPSRLRIAHSGRDYRAQCLAHNKWLSGGLIAADVAG